MKNNKVFANFFGFPPPSALLELCEGKLRSEGLPVGLRFRHVPYVLEVQYLRSLDDSENYDARRKFVVIAVTSDGNDLLVDLDSPDLQVLQREHGDIDALGLNVADLLDAEYYPLG